MMSECRGYSQALAACVARLDPKDIRARLFATGWPVTRISSALGVSREAVYRWFKGTAIPHKLMQERIAQLISG